MKKLKIWKIYGLLAMIVSGSLMHFIFDWSGRKSGLGWLLPVNESVWEHLKLGYWPVLLYSAVEFRSLQNHVNNYFPAKMTGILAFQFTILLLFYGYSAFLGKDILLLDIITYLAGAANCQWLTFRIFKSSPLNRYIGRSSLAVIIIIGLIFGITTYRPPHIELFKDHNSNTYGINKHPLVCLEKTLRHGILSEF